VGRAYVGTSGFSYAEWSGTFYPTAMKPDRYLAHYASKFATVEIDRTFYRMPNRQTLESWRADTREGFKFALKVSQKITHVERLKLPSDAHTFLESVLPALGDLLGVLLYQLPPNFRRDLGRLEAFLANRSAAIPAAFEFRHESWFVSDVYELLRVHRVGLCIADSEEGTTPIELTAPLAYVRLRRDAYTAADYERWRARFREWVGQGVDVFAYLKHEENPDAPADAMQLADGLVTPGAG